MSQLIEVKVPDIGDFADVPVIELFVKVGDTIKVDDAIATLESDKATMDVPSSAAGVVKEVLVQVGSRVAEGSVLIKLEAAGAAAAAAPAPSAPASRGVDRDSLRRQEMEELKRIKDQERQAATQAELLAKRSGRAAQALKTALTNGAKDDGSWL
jgi:pyruvate/2-oxoglutarate dehydrogenase complex dihydrolipoamide acyltransferase (E2) component